MQCFWKSQNTYNILLVNTELCSQKHTGHLEWNRDWRTLQILTRLSRLHDLKAYAIRRYTYTLTISISLVSFNGTLVVRAPISYCVELLPTYVTIGSNNYYLCCISFHHCTHQMKLRILYKQKWKMLLMLNSHVR